MRHETLDMRYAMCEFPVRGKISIENVYRYFLIPRKGINS
jgi:hypothetical protein